MKKKIVAFLTSLLAVVLSASVFGGCNLVTVDEEKDMNQVIATVSIADDAKVETIYKRDLVFAYINTGYLYTQYYGYSQAQAIAAVMNSLINNKILLQSAMEYYADKAGTTCTYDLADYLTDEEKNDAKSKAYGEIEKILKSYVDADKIASSADSLTETVRTAPTNAAKDEEDDTVYDGVDVSSTVERRNAFDRFIRFLKDNGLLGENYKGRIEETAYFEQILKDQYAAKLMENFEKDKTAEIRATFTFRDIQKAYTDAYEKQTAFSSGEFASALSKATAANPVFYGAYGNYGYVYNLLLGASDVQKAEIAAIDSSLSDADKKVARKAILDATTVKDLRSTWILSGYDFDGTKFTGGYTFSEDGSFSLEFKGEVTKVKDADDDAGTKAEYRVDSVETFDLDGFITEMETYLYGGAQAGDGGITDVSIYKQYTHAAADVENYDDKINELLFAFSTDPGSLNSYKGYVISPDNTEGWVTEFADAGKTLLTLGGNSYIIVATDYGYHVLFFSQKFEVGGAETLQEYLGLSEDQASAKYDEILENWEDDDLDKKDFLYLFTDATISTQVSGRFTNYQNSLINAYRDDANRVKVYSERYSDLLG
ncbi:MAG: hypothetical protein J5697_03130 [Clostridia bacterium]|nr:hypothetical protein [Clostridia bacterium]